MEFSDGHLQLFPDAVGAILEIVLALVGGNGIAILFVGCSMFKRI